MFSPICQQSISTQVLGSREKKSFYQALRWMDGGTEAMLAWGSGSMSCHVGATPSAAATLVPLVPPCLLLTEISLCIQCSAVEQVRFHISWQCLVISQRESCFPRKPHHVILKCFCRTCLIDTLHVSPQICDYILVSSHFEQAQEQPESSGAALSKQPWPACLPNMF